MNLRSYSRDEFPGGARGQQCFLTITRRGKVMFSRDLVRMLDLELGDAVMFHQDQDNPTEWYLHKEGPAGNGFVIKKDFGKRGEKYRFNNARFVQRLLFSAGIVFGSKNSLRVAVSRHSITHQVAGNGTIRIYSIITKNISHG